MRCIGSLANLLNIGWIGRSKPKSSKNESTRHVKQMFSRARCLHTDAPGLYVAGSTEQQSEALMHGILLCERFVANAQGTEAELEVLKQEVRKVLSGQVGCMSQHCAPWQALLVQEVLHRRLQGREPRRPHRILISLAWWLLSSHSRCWREQPPLPSPA